MAGVTATASAPGKLILFGEHAVVYGKTAIAACLSSLRVKVSVTTRADGLLVVVVPKLGSDGKAIETGVAPHEWSWPLSDLVAAVGSTFDGSDVSKPVIPSSTVGPALDAACRAGSAGAADDFVVKAMVPPIFLALGILGRKLSSPDGLSGVIIAIQAATLPVAAGLGSSAALSVATAAALLQVYFTLEKSTIIDAERPAVEIDDTRFGVGSHPAESMRALINDWAFCAETLFHGNPSGLDNTVSTYGSALKYVNSPKRMDLLSTMPPLRIVVTNTRVPKNTKSLVAGVRVLHDALPAVVDPVLDAINEISETFARVIAEPAKDGLFETMNRLVKVNQGLLVGLGVGHASLDILVAASSKYGFASKLTGAGGGGCGFTVIPPDAAPGDIAAMCTELQSHGYLCFETSVGGPGVLLH